MSTASNRIFADDVVKDVQDSWAKISDDLQHIGIEIFQRLFAAYPTYQELFKAFKDIPRDDLKNNAFYKKHALNVAGALNSAIVNLNNTDTLVSLLRTVGANHVKRNVTAEHYANAQVIIFDAIKCCLGDAVSDKELASWNEVLTVAVSTIMKGNQDEEAKFL